MDAPTVDDALLLPASGQLYEYPTLKNSKTEEPSYWTSPPSYLTSAPSYWPSVVAPTLLPSMDACQSEYADFAGCFDSYLDGEAQLSCRACADVVAEEMLAVIGAAGHLLAPTSECVRAQSTVCLAMEASCLQEACQSCAYYYPPYLLCALNEQSVAQGVGCQVVCDGGPVAAANCRWSSPPSTAAGWIGVALLAVVARWTGW